MNRFLDFIQRVSDWWFSIGHAAWLRLCVANMAVAGVLVASCVVFGIVAALRWRDGLWIEGLLIGSTILSMISSSLFGLMACITGEDKA